MHFQAALFSAIHAKIMAIFSIIIIIKQTLNYKPQAITDWHTIARPVLKNNTLVTQMQG